MCGRYSLYESSNLEARYGLKHTTIMAEANFNVSPGQFMPVIIYENGNKVAVSMKWGVIPSWAKEPKIGYKLINAREDTLFQKPIWKALVHKSRALIPARGFYEWKTDQLGQKQPYFIHPKDEKVFSFAGLYSIWKDAEGYPLPTFTIITTEANRDMKGIHDRMPVILRREDEDAWLNPVMVDDTAIMRFLHPSKNGTLTTYPVSKDVNKPANNSPNLVEMIQNSK